MTLQNCLSRRAILSCTVACLLAGATAQVPKLNSLPTAKPTVYLDFDGHVVANTAWNWDSTINAQPARLSENIVTEIFNRVAEDYRIFNINITTDAATYNKAPAARRLRLIITPTSKWYPRDVGVAFVNSFDWADGTPAWVFSDRLFNNAKYIAEAASHEIGHTLGLEHQSTYDKNCRMVTEYAEGKGDGETGWAPIMGMGYYKNLTTWHRGTSVQGCSVIQNDIDIVANGIHKIGLRGDDHGNTIGTATPLSAGRRFAANGIINNEHDRDVFEIYVHQRSRVRVQAAPHNVGTGNSGANLDIRMSLVRKAGDTIAHYNPPNLLSASLDTSLPAGRYAVVIDGVANSNAGNYGSLGYYVLTGSVDAILPLVRLDLVGRAKLGLHEFAWNYEGNAPAEQTTIEISRNGIHFELLATIPANTNSYLYPINGGGHNFYRIRITSRDSISHYSNVVTLPTTGGQQIKLMGNMIGESINLTADEAYGFQLFDHTGRMLRQGRVAPGYNRIPAGGLLKGALLLKVFNGQQQHVFRLIKE